MDYFSNVLFIVVFVVFFLLHFSASQPTCPVSSCDRTGPEIRFPFRITHQQDTIQCGYPGFDLYCNSQNKTILNLPNAGDFIVNRIDYKRQHVLINDPGFCLPKRVLNFSYSGSPFAAATPRNLTLLNCTKWDRYDATPAYCLSDDYTNMVLAFYGSPQVPPTCRYVAEVAVPVQVDSYNTIRRRFNLNRDFLLAWSVPGCGSCERKGGTCGHKDYTALETGCFHVPRGISKKLYGLLVGVGVPGLIWLIGTACYIYRKIATSGESQSQLNLVNLELITMSQPATATVSGLDRAIIESYPETVIGESRRLPNPSDGTCPICLVEYQPKETLRTIPACNHYFHANCVDVWLKLNSTCPLCRKSLVIL